MITSSICPVNSEPTLTVLNFSGGKQSSCLLWMVILNKIPRPKNFLVLNADPGMENSRTYEYVQMMFGMCKQEGIEAFTVDGPNLYQDLITLESRKATRIDNPPYWTKSNTGKRGKLIQKCTAHYKIAPMDKAIRKYMDEKFGIPKRSSRVGDNIVEKWIGFSFSESERIKPPKQRYIYFRYPLIELRMNNTAVMQFFADNHLPIPERSVCNACFSNGFATFRKMMQERPDDFLQAINVDESLKSWGNIGVADRVFVSSSLNRLKDLASSGFTNGQMSMFEDVDNESCDSGYCFI